MARSRVLVPLALSALSAQAQSPDDRSATLLFASDTQEPMRVETLWLKQQGNKQATAALFHELLAQEPTEVFLLGDVVNLGYKQQRWSLVDTLLHTARARGFTVNAVLGNHELMMRAAAGERNFQQRFPQHRRTGYCVRKDGIAVVLLNSNFDKLSAVEDRAQQQWYTDTLAALDASPEIRAVIVCCHHSPYSDSKLVGSNAGVQQRFVEPYLKASKTRLFISGHAHLFQHFRKQGKDFFVIGGGGGLHHPVRRTAGAEVCLEPAYDPLFHYLTVQREGDRLRVVSRRLNDALDAFEEGCAYDIGPSSTEVAPVSTH